MPSRVGSPDAYDWSPEDVARLQRHLDERRAEELSKDGGEETVDG